MTDPKIPTTLTREVAAADRDIFYLIYAHMMRPQDDILLSRGSGKGLRLYDEVARDPRVGSMLRKRYGAVIAREWVVDPATPSRQDRKAAELVQRILDGEWGFKYDRVCNEQLDAILKGYAIGEVMWGICDEGYIVPLDVKPKDQRRFVFDDEQRLRMLTWTDMMRGEELPERKFLVHRFGDKTGDPYGLGLGNTLFWPTFFKRQGITFWMTFADKFGSPTVVGEYPDGMRDTEQDKLLNAISNIAQRSAMVFPAGTVVRYLEASRSGTVNTYCDLCHYMDEEITLTILGETLTSTNPGGGSRAAAQTHDEIREQLADTDADLLCTSHQTQLIQWIIDLNFPGAKAPLLRRPRVARAEEEALRDQKQVQARAMAVSFVSQARQAGWTPADPNADIMDQAKGIWTYTGTPSGPDPQIAALTPQTERADAEFSAPPVGNAHLGDTTPRDAADDLSDQLSAVAMPAMTDMVQQIRDLVMTCASLDEVAEQLVRLYPKMESAKLGNIMAQAMQVADLTGRTEIIHA